MATVGQTLVLFVNEFELTRLRVKLVQLFELILQQLGACGTLGFAAGAEPARDSSGATGDSVLPSTE